MPKELTIEKWRLINDMTQRDVADILGVNVKTVGYWEKEGAKLKNVTIYALAKLYNVDVDQIKV